jgi:hypothetical protein
VQVFGGRGERGRFGLVCISGYVRETMHSTETSLRVHLTEDVVLALLVVTILVGRCVPCAWVLMDDDRLLLQLSIFKEK